MRALLCFAILALISTPVYADSFNTDSPTKSDTPYTVDKGHWQYEAEAFDFTPTNTELGDTVFKYGLTSTTDLELALAPINLGHGVGFGDVYARSKFNVFGNSGGDYSLAIVPYVKAPTATTTFGNGQWGAGAYAPFVVILPADWTMNITQEYDWLGYNNYQGLINFSHPITSTVAGYIEFWSQTNPINNQYTADLAVSWLAADNLQLDAGVNVGLNPEAPAEQVYLGISQRF